MKLLSQLLKKRYQMNLYIHLVNLIKEGRNIEAQILLQNIDPIHLVNRSGTTLLHIASENNNETMTQFLLDKQLIDIDAQDYEGKTPVMLSLTELEHDKVVRILLYFKPNLFIRDNYGMCALQMVFEMGLRRLNLIGEFLYLAMKQSSNDEVTAQTLINLGCPLHHAILLASPIITRFMLEQGCPINAADFQTGQTALHLAVTLTDVGNVEVLVEHGADIDALDSQNKTPFFNEYVYDSSEEELKILKILIERGAPLTGPTDNEGYFPVLRVLCNGNYETINILLNSNIDWRARDVNGMTPLNYLLFNAKVLRGNPEIHECLRKIDFDVNATDVDGNTLITRASSRGIWQFVQLLLDRGADPNVANFRNYSPLYLALQSRPHERISDHQKCIELLLQHAADPQIVTEFGDTIFDSIVNYKLYDQLDSVLGQLAMLEDRGIEIIDSIRAKIDAKERLQSEFEKCKRQLTQMKRSRIDKSMTVYEALNADQRTIAFRAQSDKFFFRLKRFSKKCSSNSHYCRLFQRHLEKPIKYATAWREVIDLLCDVMRLSYCSNHIVIDKIAEYVVYEILE